MTRRAWIGLLSVVVNAVAAIHFGSVLVSVFAGLLSRRVAVAPGSGEQRWFSVVILASAGYALCNLSTTLPTSPASVFLLSGPELGLLTVLVWGWLRFSQEFAGATPGALERFGSQALLATAPAMAVPDLLFSREVVDRPFPALGVVYRQAVSSIVGDAVFVVLAMVGAVILLRLVRTARRGVPHAAPVAVAFAIMLACAVADALNAALVLPLPFLLDWSFAPTVLAVGWMNCCRFVESARDVERLRGELEDKVHARTLELSSALERLHQAEKLAALGRFANGVAHEVNNPAAVVNASLSYLSHADPGRLGADDLEALADAQAGMRQITSLVRRLVDAGRIASPPGLAVADVAVAVSNVARLQPEAIRARLLLDVAAAAGACVRFRQDALEGTIEALVRNAVDAVPPDAPGEIEIRAERSHHAVRIIVADRGVGMTPEVLGRAFDPFFTTKPEGRGTGLGLAVARGVVQASGGTLSLESEPGVGTRAILQLPEVAHPAGREPEAEATAVAI